MELLEATWLGTASVRLRAGGTTLLFDPYVELPGGENPNRLADFLGADTIFITHPHLDHLASVPAILRAEPVPVCCSPWAARLLARELGEIPTVQPLRPGDTVTVGEFRVMAWPGRHIHFDSALVRHTLSPANLTGRFRQGLEIYRQNLRYQEKGETLFYHIRCGARSLQLMGSLALREDGDYPTGADVLFLPYQGSSDLPAAADGVLGRLRPKKVVLTHFDDAFPPISQSVDTGSFQALMAERWPQMDYVIPTAQAPIWL